MRPQTTLCMPDAQPQPDVQNEITPLFSGARRSWKFILKFIIFSFVFHFLQVQYQLSLGLDFPTALVRAGGLSGAMFFGLALLSSAVFKWHPQWAKYWYVRRSFGVMGMVFILLHVYAAITSNYAGDLTGPFAAGLNPFLNPVIFGVLAFPVFFILFLTSTDWVSDKLGMSRWKAIHRLVYFGYLAAIAHFVSINPSSLMNPAGYLLFAITGLALFGELYWFLRIAKQKGIRSKGTIIGILITLLYALVFWLIFS